MTAKNIYRGSAPVEYAVAVDRYLAAAHISEASRRVYRVALQTWAWLLVDRTPPTGPARRGARTPTLLLARLDGPTAADTVRRALANRALMVDARTFARESSILRNAAHWWSAQGWITPEAETAVKSYPDKPAAANAAAAAVAPTPEPPTAMPSLAAATSSATATATASATTTAAAAPTFAPPPTAATSPTATSAPSTTAAAPTLAAATAAAPTTTAEPSTTAAASLTFAPPPTAAPTTTAPAHSLAAATAAPTFAPSPTATTSSATTPSPTAATTSSAAAPSTTPATTSSAAAPLTVAAAAPSLTSALLPTPRANGPVIRGHTAALFALRVPLREQALWRLVYESAAPIGRLLALDVSDLDFARRRVRPLAGPRQVDRIGWGPLSAELLPLLTIGRGGGPVFRTERRAPAAVPAADRCPYTGRGRLSARRAAELFELSTRELDPAGLGWNLRDLRVAGKAARELARR